MVETRQDKKGESPKRGVTIRETPKSREGNTAKRARRGFLKWGSQVGSLWNVETGP